jgi:hypothetical protein
MYEVYPSSLCQRCVRLYGCVNALYAVNAVMYAVRVTSTNLHRLCQRCFVSSVPSTGCVNAVLCAVREPVTGCVNAVLYVMWCGVVWCGVVWCDVEVWDTLTMLHPSHFNTQTLRPGAEG